MFSGGVVGFLLGILITIAGEEQAIIRYNSFTGECGSFVAPYARPAVATVTKKNQWAWVGWQVEKGPSEEQFLREDQ